MELLKFFKSIIDQDAAPVVICDLEHTVVYRQKAWAKLEKLCGDQGSRKKQEKA